MVVKAYPVPYNAAGVLDGLEAMPMRALLFERADHAFNHAVLLRVCPVSWTVEVSDQARPSYGEYHGQMMRLPNSEMQRSDAEAMRQDYERWAGNFALD